MILEKPVISIHYSIKEFIVGNGSVGAVPQHIH